MAQRRTRLTGFGMFVSSRQTSSSSSLSFGRSCITSHLKESNIRSEIVSSPIWRSTQTARLIARRKSSTVATPITFAKHSVKVMEDNEDDEQANAKNHPTYCKGVPRVLPLTPETNAKDGKVSFDPKKAGWFTVMLTSAVAGIYATFDPTLIVGDLAFFFATTGVNLIFIIIIIIYLFLFIFFFFIFLIYLFPFLYFYLFFCFTSTLAPVVLDWRIYVV
jgi:hypothetical protein